MKQPANKRKGDLRPSGFAVHVQHGIGEEIDRTGYRERVNHEVTPVTEFEAPGRVITHRKELIYGVACIQEDNAQKNMLQQPNSVLEGKMQGKIR